MLYDGRSLQNIGTMEKAKMELKQRPAWPIGKAYHDSILQRHASQLKRLEQLWDWGAIRLWI